MSTGTMIILAASGLTALILIWFVTSLIELRLARRNLEEKVNRLRMERRIQFISINAPTAAIEEEQYSEELTAYIRIRNKRLNRVPAQLFGYVA